MNISLINSLYAQIMDSSAGASRRKVDLHVHTPASRDFVKGPLKEKDAYVEIIKEAICENIEIIAITDHNTFKGINYIRDNLISSAYCDILILCGIEITCFSKHILALFPDDFSVKDQESFLKDIGVEDSTQGTDDALADNLGPALLIEKIGEYGGYALLAHADSGNGFLQSLCGNKIKEGELSFSGKSLAKIIKSKNLYGIQCNSDKNRMIIQEKLNNTNYKRENGMLAYIKCSDCHGILNNGQYIGTSGHPIGSYYSELKLSELSFEALKLALLDSEMRVCNESVQHYYPHIVGVAVKSKIIKGNNEYAFFHFSSELNCIIGSRGTGKTTLLEIIQSIIMPNNLDARTLERAYQKYVSAVVYVKDEDTIYAISNEPKIQSDSYVKEKKCISDIKIYQKKCNSSKFGYYQNSKSTCFLKHFLTAGYQQRQLFDYSRNPNKILDIVDDFIKWKYCNQYETTVNQIKHMQTRLENLTAKTKKEREPLNKSFIDYIHDEGLEDDIINIIKIINQKRSKLRDMRKQMISELNDVLKGKVNLLLFCRLDDSDRNSIEEMAHKVRLSQQKNYEYFMKIRDYLKKAYICCTFAESFDFYALLLARNYQEIIESYKMNISSDDLENIRNQIDEKCIKTFLNDGLKMKYNINSGTEYNENFKDNSKISLGQNAVALLLLILNAAYNMDDNRPLLMDQPEDDLDNSYIYTTLVDEFRKSKEKRQVIISTHNPNIPVAADAENISVLRFNGQNGYLSNVGSIDSEAVVKDILEIMEGGTDAIKKRIKMYDARYGNYI